MAFPRRKTAFSRRTFRKTTRFGKRKRFSKKQFRKSNKTYTKVAGSTVGKNALVKLAYRKDFDAIVTSSDTWSATSLQTYGLTYPIANEQSSIVFLGSHCCTPLGSPNAGVLDNIAESYPLGIQNWSDFYEKAICYGSSIKITLMPVATDISLRWVLIPVAAEDSGDIRRPNATSASLRANFDALSFPSLCAYPGARWGFVKPGNNGPTTVKMFRKTKSMLGMKDIKDNQGELEMELPVGVNEGSNSLTDHDTQGWLWYFRVFNSTGNSSGITQFMVQLKYYLQLLDRRTLQQINSVIPG